MSLRMSAMIDASSSLMPTSRINVLAGGPPSLGPKLNPVLSTMLARRGHGWAIAKCHH